MFTHLTRILAAAALILTISTVSVADIPRMIHYQGVITDDQGDPITQNGVTFNFRVFGIMAGGTPIWQEGPVVVDLTDGLLSHNLGSLTSLPDSLFTKHPELWLEVEVDAETLAPRTQLLSSAYSFRVSTVDSASGGSIIGEVEIRGSSTGWQLDVRNELGGGGAGNFQVFDFGSSAAALRAQSNGTGPAALLLHDLEGDAAHAVGDIVVMDLAFNDKIRLEPTTGLSGGGRVTMFSNDDDTTVTIEGDYFGRGRIVVTDTAGNTGIEMDGLSARILIEDPTAAGGGAVSLMGKGTFSQGALITLLSGVGDPTVTVEADWVGDNASRIVLREGNDTRIEMEAYDNSGTGGPVGGARIRLFDGSNNPTVVLDADNAGDGRVTTEVLEITGGADLSEQFDISPGSVGDVEPGMVLSIDPHRIGHLRVSEAEYDPTVAGIVSGAGGVKTGLLMGQSGSVANGKFAVALTGRVWCKADASYGDIQPGDLLTTSETPGHAMKATASGRMQGAIIGKAMSSLDHGTGLVLVVVSLQ